MLYKTARYKVKTAEVGRIEEAMRSHAARLQAEFSGFFWWTIKESGAPGSDLTLIIASSEEVNNLVGDSEGIARFVDVLYPNVLGEVVWSDWEPVSYTTPIPG